MKRSVRHVRRKPARLLALTGLGVLIAAFFAAAATSGQAMHFDVDSQRRPRRRVPRSTSRQRPRRRRQPGQELQGQSHPGLQRAVHCAGPAQRRLPEPRALHSGGGLGPEITLYRAEYDALIVTEVASSPAVSESQSTRATPHRLTFTQDPPAWVQNAPATFPAQVLVKDTGRTSFPTSRSASRLNKHTLILHTQLCTSR